MSDPTNVNEIPFSKTFMGHTISLTKDWSFIVSGPEFDDKGFSMTFQSDSLARQEIEKRHSEALKIKAANINLHAILVDAEGNRHDINRINRRTGDLLPDKDIGGNFQNRKTFFPPNREVLKLLRERKEIRQRLVEIENLLDPIAIKNSRAFGAIATENYVRTVSDLIEEVETKAKLAEALTTPPVLEIKEEVPAQETA